MRPAPAVPADAAPAGFTDWTEVAPGAGGAVYRAHSAGHGDVAVKVLTVALDAAGVVRFESEGDALIRLPRSLHVHPVVAAGRLGDGRPWLASPWAAGGSLADRMAGAGPLAPDLVLRYGMQAAEGLAALQAAGAVHGSVSPGNILLVDQRAVVADMAVPAVLAARARGDGPPPRHTPPEVLEGRAWTPAGDTWALASTLWTLLTGTSPFEREAVQGIPQLLARLVGGAPPELRSGTVPAALVAVLARALTRGPDRTAGATDLAADLAAASSASASPADASVPPAVFAPDPEAMRRLDTALPAGAPPAPAGRPLGSGYLLHAPVGAGAMGQVWRASRATDGSPVAVKILRPELTSSPELVSRFLLERTSLLAVQHPNVVRVHDLVAEGDTLAIVMDLVDGPDLRRWSAMTATVAPSTACALLAQLAHGLAAVHRRGIVHRDLKPENVLIDAVDTAEPHARLTDFGVARSAAGPALTSTGSVVGTPEYLAPELAAGRTAGPPADIYALGVMAYELLAGVRPFSADHPAALLRLHLETAPVRPPGLDDALWSVIARCMEKDPQRRPSASALAAELEGLAGSMAGLPALAPFAGLPVGTGLPGAHPESAVGTNGGWAPISGAPPADTAADRGAPAGQAVAAPFSHAGPSAPARPNPLPPVAAPLPSVVVPVLPTGVSHHPAPPAPPPPPPPKQSRVPAIVAAAVVVAGVVVGGALAMSGGDGGRPPATPTTRAAPPADLFPVEVAAEVVADGTVELTFAAQDRVAGFEGSYVLSDGRSVRQLKLPAGADHHTVSGLDTDRKVCWTLKALVRSDTPPPTKAVTAPCTVPKL